MGQHNGRRRREDWHLALFFAWRNLKQQRKKTLLYMGIILVSAVVSFLFIGQMLIYRDDRKTKRYDTQAYLQKNDTRLNVRRFDGSPLTQEDTDAMRSIKNVQQADQYDYANDVNYYFWENQDYRYTYQEEVPGKYRDMTAEEREELLKNAELLDDSNFMRSSTCLQEEDLAAGHLPESRLEVVVYSDSPDVLNTERRCYFASPNLWKTGQKCYQQLKIVGLLKKETEQVYFHPELCRMLTVGVDGYQYSMNYCLDKQGFYYYTRWFYPLIADDLEGNQLRISRNFVIPETDPKDGSSKQLTLETAFLGQTLPFEIIKSDMGDWRDSRALEAYSQKKGLEYVKCEYNAVGGSLQIVQDMCNQGAWFAEVSPEFFNELYMEQSTQASVYISSYAKTDQVLRDLGKLGYDAVSSYRVSLAEYERDKVYQRLRVITLFCVVLLFTAFLEILLLRYLLKQREKEYEVLRFMGMRNRQLERIGLLELGIPGVGINLLTLLAIWAVGYFCIKPLGQFLQYQTIPGTIAWFVYNGGLILSGVLLFHRTERRKEYGKA